MTHNIYLPGIGLVESIYADKIIRTTDGRVLFYHGEDVVGYLGNGFTGFYTSPVNTADVPIEADE